MLRLFLLFTSAKVGAASQDLKAAKEDAFDSVRALWHAHAQNHQNDFVSKAGKIAALPPGYSYQTTVFECQTGDVKNAPNTFTGSLAAELRNITFPGEKDAAIQTLAAWGKSVGIDGQIRTLQNDGKHADGGAHCTGGAPDQSNGAYQAFDDALGRTLAINQSEFDKDVAESTSDLAALPVFAPRAMLAVALPALRPCLREYEL